MNYEVTIELTESYIIEVDAKDEEDAKNKAYKKFHTKNKDDYFSDSDTTAYAVDI